MSVQRPPPDHPTPIEPLRLARNARAPLAALGSRILSGYNHVMGYRRKVFFAKSLHLENLPSGASGTVTPWRTYIRTGYAATDALQLYFETIFAPGDNAAATPYLEWSESGGTTAKPLYADVDTGTIGPEDLRVGYSFFDVSANTAYEISLDAVDYARPVAATIFEVHDKGFASGATGIVQRELISTGAMITDTQHNDLLGEGHNLWLGNAAPVLSWCTDTDPDNGGTAPQRSTASYANVFDQTVTAVTNSSRGYFPYVQYHNPFHSTNVACVFAVCAKNATAPGGDVRLLDSSGALATVSTFGTTAEWKTTTVNLNGSLHRHKVDVHFQGDGSNNLTLYAFAVYEYAT